MIGNRLQSVRKQNGQTQAQFAQALEISTNGYQNYERGLTEPPVSLLLKVSDTYDVDPLWLIIGRGASERDALFKAIAEACVVVRKFGTTLPAKPPIEKEAEIVALLVRQWLDSGHISSDTAKFILETAA